MSDRAYDADQGFVVTAELPGRYFSIEIYVAVPPDAEDPEQLAREFARRNLMTLAEYVPAAKLEVTSARRLEPKAS